MYRYIALISWARDATTVAAASSLAARLKSSIDELSIAFETAGVLVAHTGTRNGTEEAYPLQRQRGVILGTLFHKHSNHYRERERIELNQSETEKIVESGGRYLVDHYWGRYVAIIHDTLNCCTHVLREPTASLTCYHAYYQGIEIIFSHAEDFWSVLGSHSSIDQRHLAQWLVSHLTPTRKTCLEGVSDIPGGERWTFRAEGRTLETLWSPATICRSGAYEDELQAEKLLRSTAQNVISAWASCYPNILLSLSGGLDSSIVAGCLAQAPSKPRVTCFNIYVDLESGYEPVFLAGVDDRVAARARAITATGDERRFARIVAERWSYSLIEARRTVGEVNLQKIWQAPLAVSPTVMAGTLDTDEAQIRAVQAHGADAFFTGMAGDSLFYASFGPVSAIDYSRRHGFGPDFLSHTLAAAALSRESFWSVAWKATLYGIWRRSLVNRYDPLKQSHLLTDEILRTVSVNNMEHPWVADCDQLAPGAREHIHGLASSCFYDIELHRQNYATAIHPLHSQPLWELSLRIPSYTHLVGGVSRGLARRAFADLLPREVRRRQAKGAGTPFFQKLVRSNMSFIRECLLDGSLVRERILDRRKLEDYLVDDQIFQTVTAVQILDYINAEVWWQQWTTSREQCRARSFTSSSSV